MNVQPAKIVSLVVLLMLSGQSLATPPATTRPAVVIELFTSEGCSTCPAADKLLSDLSVDGVDIIPLAMHVDYWDRPEWRDPYSSAKLTRRQEAYALSFGGDQVYTPQMVVDGQTAFPGGNRQRAVEAIQAAAKRAQGVISLRVTPPKKQDTKLTVVVAITDLPPITPGDVAEVYIAVTEDGLKSSVTAGENKGRTLLHEGVVREWQLAGRFDSARPRAFDRTGILPLSTSWNRERLRVVAIVQEHQSRRILAATAQPVIAELAGNPAGKTAR